MHEAKAIELLLGVAQTAVNNAYLGQANEAETDWEKVLQERLRTARMAIEEALYAARQVVFEARNNS